jgi:hypothetical protein
MDILILKTDINSNKEFLNVKNSLSHSFSINECTIDLEDTDKVLRITGDNLNLNDVAVRVCKMGFFCEELDD